MKTLQNTVEKIDKFFFDFYKNKETSVTEIHNFLLNYVDFILLYNNIDAPNYKTIVHIVNDFGENIEDFSLKQNKSKRKLRNKENIKKAKHKPYCTTIAQCSINLEKKIFNVYLNSKHFHATNLTNFENLSTLISSLGHEVEHLIQEYVSKNMVINVENSYNKKLKEFLNLVKTHKSQSNYIKKLSRKLHTHADNFSILNTCEVNADNNSVVYFQELYKLILNSTDRNNFYYYFLYDIYLDLNRIQDCRESCYKLCKKQEKGIQRSLIKQFKINPSVLEIP